MKNTIKLIGTQSLRFCVIALLAVIAFSFAACGNGTTGDDTYGCAFSESAKVERYGITVTHYLLTISFDEAKANITNALGEPAGDTMLQFNSDLTNRNGYVILEKFDTGEVRLVERNGTSLRGFSWK